MEHILYEKEVLNFLNLPKIPLKEHDGVSSFDKGVAVLELQDDRRGYAACTFNADTDRKPKVTKVFNLEPFLSVVKILVVPNYMSNIEDVPAMDLDDASKKKATRLLKEAAEKENDGIVDEDNISMDKLPEWIFDEINNREEAVAWLKNYNHRNNIKKGRIPSNDETIKLRLFAIYSELNKINK